MWFEQLQFASSDEQQVKAQSRIVQGPRQKPIRLWSYTLPLISTIEQRQSHSAFELVYFAIFSADRRRWPAWDESLIEDAEDFCSHHNLLII
jgi:hypothetical protein